MIFVRLFIVSIGIVLSILFFTNKINNEYTGIIYFSLAFFLNWLFNKFIIEKQIPENNNDN